MSRINISQVVRDTIVQLYAQTGRWCETARLIFFGPSESAKVAKNRTAPGKYPDDLIRECELARREYIAGTFKDRVVFADVPEEAT